MSNNILVIGNGFDLYHNLETKYTNFIDYTSSIKKPEGTKRIRGICQNNTFIRCFQKLVSIDQNWIDCEEEIGKIILLFKKIVNSEMVFLKYPNNHCIQKDNTVLGIGEFEKLGLMNKFVEKSNEGKILIKPEFFKMYHGIDKEKIFKTLKSELEDLIFVFKFYLERKVANQPIESVSEQIQKINPIYVINFNYTNTYERYGIQRENVCCVHGTIRDNNIVLGVKDEDEKDIDSIYFKKFFQRMQKHTDIVNWGRFPYNNSLKLIKHSNIPNDNMHYVATTYFFGHSLSNTDGDLIRQIYKFSRKICIFYLQNSKSNDYEQKIINLIDTLGKETVIQGMYSGNIEFLPIK